MQMIFKQESKEKWKTEKQSELKPEATSNQDSKSRKTVKLREKCDKHSKPIKAICSDPDCHSNMLCLLDVKAHEHPASVYLIDHISSPDYLNELFSTGSFSYEKCQSILNETLQRIKRQMDSLFEEFGKRAREDLDKKLAAIPVLKKFEELTRLQTKWKHSQMRADLERFAGKLDTVLSNDLAGDGYRELENVSKECNFFQKRLEKLGQNICRGIARGIGRLGLGASADEDGLAEQGEGEDEDVVEKAWIGTKIKQLSVYSAKSFSMPLQLKKEKSTKSLLNKFIQIFEEIEPAPKIGNSESEITQPKYDVECTNKFEYLIQKKNQDNSSNDQQNREQQIMTGKKEKPKKDSKQNSTEQVCFTNEKKSREIK